MRETNDKERMQAIYAVMYKPCPTGCFAHPETRLTDYTLNVVRENPPKDDDIPGWVTGKDDTWCKYCHAIVRIRDGHS